MHRRRSRLSRTTALALFFLSAAPAFALSAPWAPPAAEPPAAPPAPQTAAAITPAPVDPYAAPAVSPPAVRPAPAPIYYQTAEPAPSGTLPLIVDFAAIGVLASATIIDTRDIGDSGIGTMLVLSGAVGGGATGWLLAEHWGATRGDGYATTFGLALGATNAALLAGPVGLDDSSEEVLPLVLGASAAGAVGGFALSKQLDLTAGQAVFAGNASYLGVGTAALVMAIADDDADLGRDRALTALTVGLDGGALGGLLIAPRLPWSRGRAHVVSGASVVGAFLGGMIGGLVAPSSSDGVGDSDIDPRVLAASMLVGMWGGFAGGIAATRSWTPDRGAARGPTTTMAPLFAPGVVGAAASGRF